MDENSENCNCAPHDERFSHNNLLITSSVNLIITILQTNTRCGHPFLMLILIMGQKGLYFYTADQCFAGSRKFPTFDKVVFDDGFLYHQSLARVIFKINAKLYCVYFVFAYINLKH